MKLIGLSLLLLSSFAFGQNKYLVILGGGGEPEGDTTIFDSNLSLMGDFSKKHPEYQVDLSFNGGHSRTENIIWSKFGNYGKEKKFTENNFEKIISKYEKLIESGDIKEGDNLLINIDTHGSTKEGETHQVSTIGSAVEDLENLSGKTVSLDRLKKLTELAEKKGINLGIIDLSCHSGNSLSLANSKTCVISGAGSKHFGYAGDSPHFFANLFPSALSYEKNLEDAFMKARFTHKDLSFPMISSPNGEWIQNKLYDKLTPFLNFYVSGADKFTPFLEEDINIKGECTLDQNFKGLEAEIAKFSSFVQDPDLQLSLGRLKKSIKSYYDYINEIKDKMKEVSLAEFKKEHDFCSESSQMKECFPFSLEQLALIDFQDVYEAYNVAAKKADKTTKIKIQLIIENYKKAEEFRDKSFQENPRLIEGQNFWKKIPRLNEQTRLYADNVYQAEKEVYKAIYQRKVQSEVNPCRNFKI